MNYTRRVSQISLLFASLAILIAYGMEQLWGGAFLALGLGLLCGLSQYKQRWYWIIDLFLVGMVLLISFGTLLGLKLYLLLPAILFALAAWDLIRFENRIGNVEILDGVQKIEKRHLRWLGLALGSGGIFASLVLTVQIQVSFGVALFLGVILIISIGQFYRWLTN